MSNRCGHAFTDMMSSTCIVSLTVMSQCGLNLSTPPPRDCRHGSTCQGNRLEWVPESNKSKLRVCVVHHKNENRWDYLPITFVAPSSLTHMLMPWIKTGHSMVAGRGQRVLFPHAASGDAQTNVNLSQWFQQILCEFQFSPKFPPSQLRHIFVDERCSAEAVGGPSNTGAARIMGNSVERWAISYDRNLHKREVQAAADAMEGWREELLALVDQSASSTSEESA